MLSDICRQLYLKATLFTGLAHALIIDSLTFMVLSHSTARPALARSLLQQVLFNSTTSSTLALSGSLRQPSTTSAALGSHAKPCKPPNTFRLGDDAAPLHLGIDKTCKPSGSLRQPTQSSAVFDSPRQPKSQQPSTSPHSAAID